LGSGDGASRSDSVIGAQSPKALRFIEVKDYWVYILTNLPRHTVLYVGVTHSLELRTWQHRFGPSKGFTWRYNAHHLIYFENFREPGLAISRESQIKRWRRSKKENDPRCGLP
jgi:putative endonuclease